MQNPARRIIWQNRDITMSDNEFLELCDINDWDPKDIDRWEIEQEHAELYLADARDNLSCIAFTGRVIELADMGLWNGRRNGYKILDAASAGELLTLFDSCDYAEFFTDENGDLRSTQWHHDGVHHVLYRELKPITDRRVQYLISRHCDGTLDRSLLDRCTSPIGTRINEFYGW